ncbi:MAG: 23S rRNA (adenine(2503)-C(2))-methyltransferase RlmN [Planctomyces sp.]
MTSAVPMNDQSPPLLEVLSEPQSVTEKSSSKPAILSIPAEVLTSWLRERGQPAFRMRQIRESLISRRITSFAEMTNLPVALRNQLEEAFRFSSFVMVEHRTASDQTEKLLLRLDDGELVECVLMRDPGRRTVCISTQVGCAMGCVFCASGLLGVKRNLTSEEIFEQVLTLNRLMQPDEKITNVVVMGIGEPLANLKSLLPALNVLTSESDFGLGARRITISTVGLPDQIRELAESGHQYNLAVSLHAPNDELRTQIVPVNRSIGIAEILAAADDYFAHTGRRISYEYVLLAGVNDQPEHAEELAQVLRGRNAHVNLIPMNGVSELHLAAPIEPSTRYFREILELRGITATIRKRKGADIDAACGQLRRNRTVQNEQAQT